MKDEGRTGRRKGTRGDAEAGARDDPTTREGERMTDDGATRVGVFVFFAEMRGERFGGRGDGGEMVERARRPCRGYAKGGADRHRSGNDEFVRGGDGREERASD